VMQIEINGIEQSWEVAGEGEPLLWLHGAMGSGPDWRYIFDEPPAGYQVIAPDLRGHGASTNPDGAFTFKQAAADVLALLRHLNLSKVKAIGLSGGGITLLHMATLQPARVASMVVVSAPPYFPERAKAIQRQFSEAMLPEAEREAMRKRHVRGDAQLRELFVYVHAFAENDDDVRFTPPMLSTITADTLIVFGDRDFLYPVSIAFELHAAIPRSYLWVVPNGSHGPIFGAHATQFVQTAMAFLNGEWKH
jgi:pimeloyl-ACP methyl ester carboxylesterase